MNVPDRNAAVILEKVRKDYGSVTAVQEVSIEITAGSLVTLLGPSGCGKTTTLRMIAGLETPTSGRIFIGGKDVTLLPPNERDVSMVFQSYALFPHMTVIENVAYGLAGSGLGKSAQIEKAHEGLRLVGLEGYDARFPSELSGGQQQRVACARALVLEPQVLLFDEPLSNLDAKLRRRMREEIRDLQQGLHLTSVYVTHDQEEALAVSDRIVVMNAGAVAQEGSPADLYERPADSFVADFIGGANLIACKVRSRDGDWAIVDFAGKVVRVRCPAHVNGEAFLVVRSASVSLERAGTGGDAGVAATIAKAVYLGSHWEYVVDGPFGSILVTQPVDRRFEKGSAVAVGLDPAHVCLVARDQSGAPALPTIGSLQAE